MAGDNDVLAERLLRSREIRITVIGRKSGKKISLPVWFVWEEGKLYLLPVSGSDSQWYKNALKNPLLHIKAGGAEREFRVVAVRDAGQVKSVVEKFRGKYSAGDVKKYYSKFDVAMVAQPE